jgi:hypothetical protein
MNDLSELVRFTREQGYRSEELIAMIEAAT